MPGQNPKSDASRQLEEEGASQLRRIQSLNKPRALDALQALDPLVFEHLVAALFKRRGFRATAVGATGDEGVDVRLRKRLSSAVVQCKRYKGSVGQPVVRDLYGTMLHNDAKEAYLVTTGRITRQAQAWAEGKPIYLVDGYQLVEWIITSRTARGRLSTRSLFVLPIVILGLSISAIYVSNVVKQRRESPLASQAVSTPAGQAVIPPSAEPETFKPDVSIPEVTSTVVTTNDGSLGPVGMPQRIKFYLPGVITNALIMLPTEPKPVGYPVPRVYVPVILGRDP